MESVLLKGCLAKAILCVAAITIAFLWLLLIFLVHFSGFPTFHPFSEGGSIIASFLPTLVWLSCGTLNTSHQDGCPASEIIRDALVLLHHVFYRVKILSYFCPSRSLSKRCFHGRARHEVNRACSWSRDWPERCRSVSPPGPLQLLTLLKPC